MGRPCISNEFRSCDIVLGAYNNSRLCINVIIKLVAICVLNGLILLSFGASCS